MGEIIPIRPSPWPDAEPEPTPAPPGGETFQIMTPRSWPPGAVGEEPLQSANLRRYGQGVQHFYSTYDKYKKLEGKLGAYADETDEQLLARAAHDADRDVPPGASEEEYNAIAVRYHEDMKLQRDHWKRKREELRAAGQESGINEPLPQRPIRREAQGGMQYAHAPAAQGAASAQAGWQQPGNRSVMPQPDLVVGEDPIIPKSVSAPVRNVLEFLWTAGGKGMKRYEASRLAGAAPHRTPLGEDELRLAEQYPRQVGKESMVPNTSREAGAPGQTSFLDTGREFLFGDPDLQTELAKLKTFYEDQAMMRVGAYNGLKPGTPEWERAVDREIERSQKNDADLVAGMDPNLAQAFLEVVGDTAASGGLKAAWGAGGAALRAGGEMIEGYRHARQAVRMAPGVVRDLAPGVEATTLGKVATRVGDFGVRAVDLGDELFQYGGGPVGQLRRHSSEVGTYLADTAEAALDAGSNAQEQLHKLRQAADTITAPLSAEEDRLVRQVLNGQLPINEVPQKVQDAAHELRAVFDREQALAEQSGTARRLGYDESDPTGRYVEVAARENYSPNRVLKSGQTFEQELAAVGYNSREDALESVRVAAQDPRFSKLSPQAQSILENSAKRQITQAGVPRASAASSAARGRHATEDYFHDSQRLQSEAHFTERAGATRRATISREIDRALEGTGFKAVHGDPDISPMFGLRAGRKIKESEAVHELGRQSGIEMAILDRETSHQYAMVTAKVGERLPADVRITMPKQYVDLLHSVYGRKDKSGLLARAAAGINEELIKPAMAAWRVNVLTDKPLRYGLLQAQSDVGMAFVSRGIAALNPKTMRTAWQSRKLLNDIVRSRLTGEALDSAALATKIKLAGGETVALGDVLQAYERYGKHGAANFFDIAPGQGLVGRAMSRAGRAATTLSRGALSATSIPDEMLRLTTFMSVLKDTSHQGITRALKVTEQLAGDMRRITGFENDIARNVLPFYMWNKFHAGWLTREMGTNPARLARFTTLKNYLERTWTQVTPEANVSDKAVPKWQQTHVTAPPFLQPSPEQRENEGLVDQFAMISPEFPQDSTMNFMDGDKRSGGPAMWALVVGLSGIDPNTGEPLPPNMTLGEKASAMGREFIPGLNAGTRVYQKLMREGQPALARAWLTQSFWAGWATIPYESRMQWARELGIPVSIVRPTQQRNIRNERDLEPTMDDASRSLPADDY